MLMILKIVFFLTLSSQISWGHNLLLQLFILWMKSSFVTIQMNPLRQIFYIMLFIYIFVYL